MASSHSKSSRRWLREHFSDSYVKKAHEAGYRSRAVFKLLEIQERDKLFRQGMLVIDLGAAPGGWSQLAAKWVGPQGAVFALDVLPMEPLPGVQFIQGDFEETSTLETLLSALEERRADLIMSDMAPNMSGMNSIDQPRMIALAELAVELADQLLKPEGTLLIKIFQGEGFDAFYKNLRQTFKQVLIRKPEASRSRSREVYLLAKGYIVNTKK